MVFIRKEYRPSQRVHKILGWSPFIWLVTSPSWLSRHFSLNFVTFTMQYMSTRSFHAFKAFDRIVYFRKWGK